MHVKTRKPGAVKFPRVYQAFKCSQEIADVINRSSSYVKKALRSGFTERERKMLEAYAERKLFE